MEQQSPPLFRPIPRRPFNVNLTSPTPPDDDPDPATATPDLSSTPQLLNPLRTSDSESLPRSQSILNLTSSTLFGIFSPSTPNRDQFYGERDETDTPWGTGAQSPIDTGRRRDLDEATCALLRERSEALVRRSTADRLYGGGGAPSPSRAELAWALGLRTGLLFLLGMGYGALVTRLRVENPFSKGDRERAGVGAAPEHNLNWVYLATWGLSGVALGALLPWFDGVWQAAFGAEAENEAGDGARNGQEKKPAGSGDPKPGTDWNHVVRSIGAFIGIVFALRRLPWVSTLQVSLALALVNPFLWYLVDRTKPGLLLSVAVGVAGSLALMGINPNMMPAPSTLSPPWNATVGASVRGEHLTPPLPGILAHKETIETGMWVLSVLFCSCVCFGNVGRRLALSKSAAAGAQ